MKPKNIRNSLQNERDSNPGSLIKRLRIRLGLSLAELAVKSTVSISHVGRIENAQRSTDILKKIAQPLGLDEAGLKSKL